MCNGYRILPRYINPNKKELHPACYRKPLWLEGGLWTELLFFFTKKENIFSKEWWKCRSRLPITHNFYDVPYNTKHVIVADIGLPLSFSVYHCHLRVFSHRRKGLWLEDISAIPYRILSRLLYIPILVLHRVEGHNGFPVKILKSNFVYYMECPLRY